MLPSGGWTVVKVWSLECGRIMNGFGFHQARCNLVIAVERRGLQFQIVIQAGWISECTLQPPEKRTNKKKLLFKPETPIKPKC